VSLPVGIEDALDKVADGAPVDWDALQEHVNSPEASAIVRNLRILARLGDTHRGEPDSLAATSDEGLRSPLPSSLGEGSYWGRYRLIRIIGEGSYGTVYLARDEQLDREVALKLLHRQLIEREDVKAEGRALARVEHPSVLPIYGIEEHGGRLALCMKYVRGRTLEEIIRSDGPMNADEALVVAKAVLSAVAAVHAAGILHRDVKARNVMRERAGRYMLMDFGAGVMQASDGSSGREATVGTPLYMAPELFYGAPASRKTDIYAVGVLLYFLVTGEYPVSGDTVDTLKAAHRDGRRTRLDERRTELPEAYIRAVDAATSPDPAERPESVAVLLRALSPRDSIGEEPQRRMPGWARLIASTVAAVIALALASGLLTSWTFNTIVDRPPEFDAGSYLDAMAIGFRSLLFPTLVSGALLAFAAVIPLVGRIVSGPKEWLHRSTMRGLAHLPRSEYAAALAQLAVVLGISSVVFLIWAFGDVVYAFVRPISYSPLEVFSVFRPENFGRRVAYRLSVVTLLVVVALVWRSVRGVRRANGGTVPVWVRAAAVALVSLLALLSQAPYKAMFHNQVPVVVLDGTRCYVLGEQGETLRVFCPSSAVPRVRTVESTRMTLERCGSIENIFAASPGATCPPRTEQ
jgi:serine/threonine protein kinase